MEPVELRSERLTLSVPTLDDVDAITRYCQDPLFERYLTTPWPYSGPGNLASARDGSHPDSWHAELTRDDDRDPKPGWPL